MEGDQRSVLDHLEEEDQMVFWAEGFRYQFKHAVNRTMLTGASRLAILTAPPSSRELRDALDQVLPKEVFLFSLESPSDSVKDFLADVQKFIRVKLQGREVMISLSSMAAMLGQTIEVAFKGLQWYQLRGQLEVSRINDQVRIKRIKANISPDIEAFTIDLMNLLKETAAFRNYYLRADPAVLLG